MDKLYIPGDLISVYVGVKKYIVEVIGTENENEVLLYQIKFPNGEIQYADKDNIVPIPLTSEILEKNGWAKDKEGYINDSYHLHLCGKYDEYSVYKVVNDNVVWLTGVRNVSDLQHLLFGLGINHEMEA
jgi:hypothetical protein